jgi:DNA-binding NtrC family response regulator
MKARSEKRSKAGGKSGEIRGYTELRQEVLLRFQTDYVWRLLIAAEGNVSLAARMARIDRKQLWRLIRKTGIRIQRPKTATRVRRPTASPRG